MRLFLIKNVSRDPRFASRRRANPLYVTKSPTICGKRLFPRVVMRVEEAALTEAEAANVERFIKAGVVTVSVSGGPSDLQSLGLKQDEPVVPEVVETPEEVVEVVEEPVEEVPEEDDTVEIPEEESPVDVEELVQEEESEEAENLYTEDELSKMKNAELREILSLVDPDFPSGGVKKSDLIAAILEKQ